MPKDEEDLPDTLQRSPEEAQETFIKAHDSAEETYDDPERAHRVAWSAVKHKFEKVGDRWEPKDEWGPSDPRAESGGPDPEGETYGGVDLYGNSKEELYERAKDLDIEGRSKMSKEELAEAIAKHQD